MDRHTPEQRHRNMSNVHSKDTKPEVWLRKKLFAYGYRYRKNVKRIPGHPDLWMAKYNTAVFMNGCFWHRHSGCKYASMPKTRIDFWEEKFQKNIERDECVKTKLYSEGIKRLVVWECTVKKMMRDTGVCEDVMKHIGEFLSSENMNMEI